MAHDSARLQGAATTLVRLPDLDAPMTIPDVALAPTIAAEGVAKKAAAFPDDPSFALRYEAGDTLGEGGMGVVRLANDRRIGRDVAVKSMRPLDATRRDLVARFLREACVQGQLEHPAIVPVYDLGRDPDGLLYFSMKRVRGVTFERIVASLKTGDEEALRDYSRRKLLTAFASACQAIQFAHTRGVLHRDLKPANVMLGDFGEVYVLDWGVAKITGVADLPVTGRPSIVPASDPGSHTLAGATLGTPGYMSPEQMRGEGVDARADVYSLGTILFELLALETLHSNRSLEAALVSTLDGVDARPSVRAPDRDIAPELDSICERATRIDPAARFESVRDLLLALERFLDGDRDLERRRLVSTEHARDAQAAAAEALAESGDATSARRRALQEVGRALALDPSNTSAVATLVELLTTPPKEMPPEAASEMGASARRAQRSIAKGVFLGYLAWFLFVPFGLWMGIREPFLAVTASALWAVAAVAAFVALRRSDRAAAPRTIGVFATALAACTTSAVFGPYVVVPTLAVINVMLWLLFAPRTQRLTIVGLACLTILVPAAMDWSHLARFYHFRADQVTIVPNMLDFPAIPTHAFLLAASVGLVGVATALIARFRDDLTAAERKLHLQAWQLKQLAPREAHDVEHAVP